MCEFYFASCMNIIFNELRRLLVGFWKHFHSFMQRAK